MGKSCVESGHGSVQMEPYSSNDMQKLNQIISDPRNVTADGDLSLLQYTFCYHVPLSIIDLATHNIDGIQS